MDRFLHTATDEEIAEGKTTDIYFARTRQVLEKTGLGEKKVVMELTSHELPRNWSWAVLTGTVELIRLLEGLDVDLYIMREGTIFRPKDDFGVRVPVGFIEGRYGEFCVFETPALGLICQSTGVSTAAARLKMNVMNKPIVAFGARRMHPAIAPMLDWAAYVGGFDAVSTVVGAELLGVQPTGTMPHSLILVSQDQVEAWKAFDSVVDKEVPRILLADTLCDEKMESLMASDALKGRVSGVRLDTPSSRRGNMPEIVREVRWELDVRGHHDVKVFVSGGLTEESVMELSEAGAEGFGVGTSVSAAPVVDFAADIVEIDNKPVAKRGKLSGKKQVWRCEECLSLQTTLFEREIQDCQSCGGKPEPLLYQAIHGGRIVTKLPTPQEAREYVLAQIGSLPS